jgi:hypothetical protein
MDTQLESMLDRAGELLKELEDEYSKCLKTQSVTKRAMNLTHEVLEKLRNALDHTMRQAWGKYVAPNLSEEDKDRVRVYFPIVSDLDAFKSSLGRGGMANLEISHKDLYEFLMKQQPFSSKQNQWLEQLAKIAAEGKHVRLIPQKRRETRMSKVSTKHGSISWDQSAVKFSRGIHIMGAPIDPTTQRIIPTPGVTQQVEIWVSFILPDYGLNALGFCRETYKKTRNLTTEMVDVFKLSDM